MSETNPHRRDPVAPDSNDTDPVVGELADGQVDRVGGVRLAERADVPMRDGVRLRADVYVPDGDGPWPAIVARTPYGRRAAQQAPYAHPLWYARRGFAVVWQDTRGRGDSEGTFEPFASEAEDGHDTIEWVASRPWCTGRVGTMGYSYAGATQILPAALAPAPSHAAMAAGMTAPPREWMYRGRTLNLGFALGWAVGLGIDAARRAGDLAAAERFEWLSANRGELFRALPVAGAIPDDLRRHVPFVERWLRGPWDPPDPVPGYERIAVPGLHVAGWYDAFCEGTVEAYSAAAAAGRAEQRLLVGPWWHMPWSRFVGGQDFGPAAEPAVDEAQLEFFGRHLRGDAHVGPPVRLFVMARNDWLDAEAWPPPGAEATVFHLRSAGRANSLGGDGRLSRESPGADELPDVFISDPLVPVASLGGRGCCAAGLSPMGPADQRPQELRRDVLLYDSPPLERPVLVAGSPELVVHAGADVPSFDVVARLVDVHPDGRAINVTDGQVRVAPGDVRPGDVAAIRVRMAPTAVELAAGHRIRLDVCGSSFPMYDRNPHSGVDPRAATMADLRVATQIVFHDANRPSTLSLPILPR